MGEDKAWLDYHGAPQWQRARTCVAPFVERAYVSVSAEQARDKRFGTADFIQDRWENIGPMNGIASAMQTHPEAAWLVVACDMPSLDEATLSALMAQRSPESWASVVENTTGQLEPLCGIYEPSAAPALFDAIEKRDYSLHRCLTQWPLQRILLKQGDASLHNINTPEESKRFRDTQPLNQGSRP